MLLKALKKLNETLKFFLDVLFLFIYSSKNLSVLYFLVWFEKLLQTSPWPLVILVILILVYLGSRSIYLTIGSLFALLLIGYFGMWEDTMSTVSIIGVCTFMSIGLGIPIGIAMSNSDRARAAITPILDVMQTMPVSYTHLTLPTNREV